MLNVCLLHQRSLRLVAYIIEKTKLSFTYQDPASFRGETTSKDASKKRSQAALGLETVVSWVYSHIFK